MHRVLLVEDEKILRDAYTLLIGAQSDILLDVATNGHEALNHCKKNTYDLILLDLMMPVLDGIGFLKESQIATKSPYTRILVLSNLSAGEESARALSLGAHRHAVKSDLAPNEVLSLIREELSLVTK